MPLAPRAPGLRPGRDQPNGSRCVNTGSHEHPIHNSQNGIEMSTASIPAAPAMVPTTTRKAVKAMAAAAIFTGACFGVYHGAQAITSHYQRPDTTHAVSYADRATIDATLTGAWHPPATAGDFRASADITGGNVVSVVVEVP